MHFFKIKKLLVEDMLICNCNFPALHLYLLNVITVSARPAPPGCEEGADLNGSVETSKCYVYMCQLFLKETLIFRFFMMHLIFFCYP